MSCSRLSALETLASALVDGARMELYLTPKPGLVDLHDAGSHPDLTLPLMERSIDLIAGYIDELTNSLQREEVFACQQAIALRAERRLFAELGTNTHKGYIFLSGMLLIASWQSPSPVESDIRKTLSSLASSFFTQREAVATHGQQARTQFAAGGIVREAIDAYPSLFDHALPVYRAQRKLGRSHTTASFAMLGRLMQTVEDTTTLHRGGAAGLARIKRDGRKLEALIREGGDYRSFLSELNHHYIRLNLTIGGVADMIGIGFSNLIASGEISLNSALELGQAA